MGYQQWESLIREHAKEALSNSRIRNKDLLAWCICGGCDDVPDHYKPEENEVGVYLAGIQVFAVYPAALDKRKS